MVKLTKIYTRTGDEGATGLGTGERVSKTSARVTAYGDVDEANASLGLAILAAAHDDAEKAAPRLRALLQPIQHDLFDLGADLCIPRTTDEKPGDRLRVEPALTRRLETAIDELNEALEPLTSFVLPGGSPLAAALHVARTVVRRAERSVVALLAEEPVATNPETLRYLNRLSDLLFVMARYANARGADDVLWKPGANRRDDDSSE